MALPPRLKQKKNRTGRWRSTAHCDFVRSHACSVPDCNGRPIEVAHLRNGTDAGMGRKASDFYTISLCADHHRLGGFNQHAIGEDSFAEVLGRDPHDLAREFCQKSPRAAQIRDVKRERGL